VTHQEISNAFLLQKISVDQAEKTSSYDVFSKVSKNKIEKDQLIV